VRQSLNAHGCSEVKALGDGFMASLPIYPGATLVQKYVTSGLRGIIPSYLWHVYAASDDGQAVRAFYKQNLADLGWQFDPGEGNDTLLGRFYKGNAEVDVFVWDHEMPPNPDKGQVAKPPPGTAAFFTIKVYHWQGVRRW
jgi:hypothetical protein